MKNLIITFSMFSLFACKQEVNQKTATEKSSKKINIMQNPDINSKNFVSKIFEKVKHYPKEPIYYIRIGKANCVIEVLVNDYPVHNDYELSNYATPIEINHGILKSGIQKLTYRLYPIGDLMKENYSGDSPTVTTLTDLTSVNIKIIQMDNKGEKKFKDEVLVIEHNSQNDKNGNFIASGKPYYEYTFEFIAEVPYELEGWTNGQDLTKLNQKLLEDKALEFHEIYQKVYENQDGDALAKIEYNAIKRQSIMYYQNEIDINEMWEDISKMLYVKSITFNQINNYKKVFFGNKKILMLMQNSLDIEYRGLGMFHMNYDKIDGSKTFMLAGLDLYLPKDKKLEDGLYIIE